MNYITIEKFKEDVEGVIESTIQVDELTHIHTEKGNVVMMSEEEFENLMQTVASRKHIYKQEISERVFRSQFYFDKGKR